MNQKNTHQWSGRQKPKITSQILSVIQKPARSRVRKNIGLVLAGIVVFTTTYSLILPALTLEQDMLSQMPGLHLGEKPEVVEVLSCGKDEHQHMDSCYQQVDGEPVLSCDLGEHQHTKDCYTEQIVWVDDDAETEGSTTEAAGGQQNVSEENVQPESASVVQSDEELLDTETVPESTESAQEQKQTETTDRSLNDDAIDTKSSDESNDITNPSFNTDENNEKKNSSFNSDLNNGKENISPNNDSASWLENTANTFLDQNLTVLTFDGGDYEVVAKGLAGAVIPDGAVLEVAEITQESDSFTDYEAAAKEQLSDPNAEVVAQRFFDIHFLVNGEKVEPDTGVTVEIRFKEAQEARENQKLSIVHFVENSAEAAQAEDLTAEVQYTVNPADEAERPEVQNPETVITEASEAETTESGQLNPEILETTPTITEAGVESVQFRTGSFSVFGVVYTVDFHYEVDGKTYDFSIPGGGCVTLSDVVTQLGLADSGDRKGISQSPDVNSENSDKADTADSINGQETEKTTDETVQETSDVNIVATVDAQETEPNTKEQASDSSSVEEFLANVADVTFSSPNLVSVSKAEETTTIGAIKDRLGLVCEYSEDLTEEQIAEINAQKVEVGDWALISLRFFTSEETLTVTMKNGDVFTITLTDPVTDTKPENMQTLTTANTRSEGVKMWLFDYDLDGSLDNQNNKANTDNNKKDGINNESALKFLGWGAGNSSGSGWGINDFTGLDNANGSNDVRALQGIVKNTLSDNGNGYPVLNNGTSLDYLFDPNANTADRRVYGGTRAEGNVNWLFEYKDGYYQYDSNHHYAELQENGKDFTVYTSTLAQTDKNGNTHNPPRAVGFFPFDTYEHVYKDLKYENDGSKYGNKGTLYLNPDGSQGNSGLNHHLGVGMEMSFEIPENGTVDGTKNGTPVSFAFSGDDDMWVFIDGQLVLDIGGLHQPVSGDIDFKTGKATIVGNHTQNGHTDNTGAAAIVTANGAVDPRGNNFDFYSALGIAPGDGKTHTMKIFYMERGGCDSNCKITFNLPLTKGKGDVKVAKYDSAANPPAPLKGVKFGLYSDAECKNLVAELTSDDNGNLEFKDLAVKEENQKYYLKETKALDGYKTDDTVYTLQAEKQQNGDYTFKVLKNGQEIGTIGENPALPVIYNEPKTIELSVNKTWLDADGNEMLDTSKYSATFTAHRVRTYKKTVEPEPVPTSTLTIGYYGWNYYQGKDVYTKTNESYTFAAGTSVKIPYSYHSGYNGYYDTKGYRLQEDGYWDYLDDDGVLQVTMPEAGEELTVYFYDGWRANNANYYGQDRACTVGRPNGVEPSDPEPVTVEQKDEYDKDFSATLKLDNGATSGTFAEKFPLKETINGTTYTYKYYITEEPVEGFTSTSGGHAPSNEDFTETFVNRKNPIQKPIDVDEQPQHHKTLTENKAANGKWDGTYTLSLDVTGKAASAEESSSQEADIILVLDMSSSLTDNFAGEQTRFESEKKALQDTVIPLMDCNKDGSDKVHLALVTFGNDAEILQDFTGDKSVIEDKINNLQSPPTGKGGVNAGGVGTNWEAGLQSALQLSGREDVQKYVLFISDGKPTFRRTRGDLGGDPNINNSTNDQTTNKEDTFYREMKRRFGLSIFGLGTDEPAGLASKEDVEKTVNRCYSASIDEAEELVTKGYSFYSVAIYEPISNMESLANVVGGTYIIADDGEAIAETLNTIFTKASKAVDFRNVKITDPMTVAAKTTASVTGTPVDFKYYKVTKDKDGNETAIEWTGGPQAKYTGNGTGGSIEWDISAQTDEKGNKLVNALEKGALENDVTYRVSFTVWPNQNAYDAVLKLNEANGDQGKIKSILEQYPDVAASIVKTAGGQYTIYSNGEGAKVSYTQYVDNEQGKDGELFYNRPVMETLQYYMKVAKVWNDSIYPDNRLNKVKFEVYEDYDEKGQNTPYQTIILDQSNVSASDPSRWEATIPISPAIQSDTIVKDTKLNAGHEYTVKEYIWVDGQGDSEGKWVSGDTDFHYEFDPEKITPILKNGDMVYDGDANKDTALSGVNHVRGSVTITKQIVDKDGNTVTSNLPTDEFTFRITLIDPKGDEIKDKTKNDADAIWYKRLKDDGSEMDEATVINSGDTFTLQAGHSLRLINVPIGVRYKVEEVTSGMPAGYQYNSVTYTYKTGAAGSVQDQMNADGLYTVSANTWHYVVVNNKQVDIGYALPSTGGPGTMLMFGIGAVLAEITGMGMIRKRRKMLQRCATHKIIKKR